MTRTLEVLDDPALTALIGNLLGAAPRARSALVSRITRQIYADPARAALLPPLDEVPADGPRQELANVHGMACYRRGDVEGLRALVAACEPSIRWTVLHGLGNQQSGHAAFASIAAERLADADADAEERCAALYFLGQMARLGGDLSPYSGVIEAAATDRRKSVPHKKTVASAAAEVQRAMSKISVR
jgi:hypothetical protein